jgi:hypothetical protein
MLAVNTEVHLRLKVAGRGVELNDLAAHGRRWGLAMSCEVIARVLWSLQEGELQGVCWGTREVACPGCGVVHCGPGSLLRRGRRLRMVQTSSGRVRFALRQVSCGACRKTFCPFGSALGLRPRQRVAEELVEQLANGVMNLSYEKTSALGRDWLGGTVGPRTLWRAVQHRGSQVAFTRRAPLDTFLVDGTRVRCGRRQHGEAAVLGLQLEGREGPARRIRVRKRLLGFGVGREAWPAVLATGSEAPLVVTDAASGVRELVSAACPRARHQLCEWHLTHSLKHFLTLHGVRPAKRRALASELARILRRRSARARTAYWTFWRKLRGYRSVASLLEQAAPYIMHPDRSRERTNSIAEREMRELNRRTDVGVRWSVPGVRNLLTLKLARRHNPDDYARVWQRKRPISWHLVPQPA